MDQKIPLRSKVLDYQKKKGDYGVVESWTQKVGPSMNFKSIFGCMGSDELMISSIRPFSSDRLFLFDLESLNENNLELKILELKIFYWSTTQLISWRV